MSLRELGWNEELGRLFAPHSNSNFLPGRVVRAERGRYLVSDGAQDWAAEISGRLHHACQSLAELPVVGDWVALRLPPGSGPALIESVLPRKSKFRRKAAGTRTDEQVLAANVDWLLVVVGLDGDYNLRRIERYLVASHDSGAALAIVLNKADGRPDAAAIAEEVRRIRDDLRVLVVSAATGQGCEELAAMLEPELTFALVGSSGVGKSTLINRLLGSERLATASVRQSDDRGRHTTTHRELVVMPQGAILMDTPGLRELGLWADGVAGWDELFPDIAELGQGCRYRDCQHQNEPGCAVQAALESGELSTGRFQSYAKQRRELDYNQARQDQRAKQTRDARRKEIARASRQYAKLRGKW